jgi:hypothetical protein
LKQKKVSSAEEMVNLTKRERERESCEHNVFRVNNVHGVTILVNTRTETKKSRGTEHFEINFFLICSILRVLIRCIKYSNTLWCYECKF